MVCGLFIWMLVNPMFANLPLNVNCDLAKPGLTSLVTSTNSHHTGLYEYTMSDSITLRPVKASTPFYKQFVCPVFVEIFTVWWTNVWWCKIFLCVIMLFRQIMCTIRIRLEVIAVSIISNWRLFYCTLTSSWNGWFVMDKLKNTNNNIKLILETALWIFCYFLSGHKKGRTPCASPINRNVRVTIIFLVPNCQ